MLRLIKLALISFLIIFLIGWAFSLLIPSHIRISRAVNIQAPPDSILALVKDTQRWPEWHPAFPSSDSSRRLSSLHIDRRSASDSEVVFGLQQQGKIPVINGYRLYRYPHVDSVTLQWYMDFNLKWYPWQKFSSLFFENTYGPMMEQGLSRIKEITQAQPPETMEH